MGKKVNLLEGNISSALIKLALPIMGTSLIQMAYNLTDMMWIGRVGADAVTAVGTAGFYIWIGNGLSLLPRMGGQVRTGYYLGAGRKDEARDVISNTLKLTIIIMLLYSLLLYVFNKPLIDFFQLHSQDIVNNTRNYLYIVIPGIVLAALNVVVTGLITADGNSSTPFKANTIGLLINIVLDPILIFGFGPFPRLEVEGAAIATVIAQFVVFLVLLMYVIKDKDIFCDLHIKKLPSWSRIKNISSIGIPTAAQNLAFALIAMYISRIIVNFGDEAVAIQRVGSQIESLSWMTADGFAVAINAFISQNYGANKIDRAQKGYIKALKIITIWGIIVSCILYFGAKPLFGIFLPEKELIILGANYLQILAVSQLFMCFEGITAGAFAGYGQTVIPSVVGIAFTAARIPVAKALAFTAGMGLNGVWWTITLSSVLKGILALVLFRIFIKKKFGNKMESTSDRSLE